MYILAHPAISGRVMQNRQTYYPELSEKKKGCRKKLSGNYPKCSSKRKTIKISILHQQITQTALGMTTVSQFINTKTVFSKDVSAKSIIS